MKKLIFLIIALLFVACSTNVTTNSPTKSSENIHRTSNIGGWYPVFFDTYDELQIKSIIYNANSGNVSKIIISYDQNVTLANVIRVAIQTKTNVALQFIHNSFSDEKSATFNHNRVVVIVYNN